jgi:signal transduction histidine kinase
MLVWMSAHPPFTAMLRGAALAVWAAVGASVLLETMSHVPAVPLTCYLSWAGAFGMCGLTLWLPRLPGTGRWPRLALALLAVQAVSVVWTVSAWDSEVGGLLLVITAWQAAELLPLRWAFGWALGQAALLGAVRVADEGPLWYAYAAVHAGLGLFAVLIAHLARSETAARYGLAQANRELVAAQELLAQSSRQAERMRLARELHDGMGHRLTALSLSLEVASRLQTDGSPQAAAEVARARGISRHLIGELRAAVDDIRAGEGLDLDRALAALTAGIERPRVACRLHGELKLDDPARAHALVRCVQEIVTNAVRHSQAENLWIDVVATSDGVVLKAHDDGRGAPTAREGNGLAGMRERLVALGGRLQWSGEAPGFRTTVWLPAVHATADPARA